MSSSTLDVLTLLGGILGLIGVVVAPLVFFGMRHDAKKREMEHTERMKALELGHALPDDSVMGQIKAITGIPTTTETHPSWTIVHRCFSTAFWLPVGAFVGSMMIGRPHESNYGLWIATGAISVVSVICGTALTLELPRRVSVGQPMPNGKPSFDPDAYDVASRRG